jgi:hypothetical protein
MNTLEFDFVAENWGAHEATTDSVEKVLLFSSGL